MDKGQHLRLFITKQVSSSSTPVVVALATDLTFHVSASTEDSTTKDTTDTNGNWQEFDVTGLSYDIQIGALIALADTTGTDTAYNLNDFLTNMTDTPIDWELAVVSGTNNRTKGTSIATGKGKITNISPTGTNRQVATYTATIAGYGPYTVAS